MMRETIPIDRRTVVQTLGAFVGGGAFVGSATARPRNYNVHLTGDVHGLDTNAQGQANFQYRSDSVEFELIVSNIEDVVMAHIHLDEVLGPISVWLHDFGSGSPDPVDGRFDGVLSKGTITDAEVGGPIDTVEELVEEFEAENAWVNVHTKSNLGGELGGRIQSRQ